jgi:hypothetical protein
MNSESPLRVNFLTFNVLQNSTLKLSRGWLAGVCRWLPNIRSDPDNYNGHPSMVPAGKRDDELRLLRVQDARMLQIIRPRNF